MPEPRRLMCVLAHPDDESFAMGGTLAKYSREGVESYVVLATRGERGRCGTAEKRLSAETLGQVREQEARAACAALGVRSLSFLDYLDGSLDRVDPAEVVAKITAELRLVRPQVVATLPPDGGYGHPDHIAICQLTSAAVLRAADPAYTAGGARPHLVSKLYYAAWNSSMWDAYEPVFGSPRMVVDSVERRQVSWPDWAATAVIDCGMYCEVVWRAVQCHRTQIARRPGIDALSEGQLRALWGEQRFYRAFSLVNGGRMTEADLFAGVA